MSVRACMELQWCATNWYYIPYSAYVLNGFANRSLNAAASLKVGSCSLRTTMCWIVYCPNMPFSCVVVVVIALSLNPDLLTHNCCYLDHCTRCSIPMIAIHGGLLTRLFFPISTNQSINTWKLQWKNWKLSLFQYSFSIPKAGRSSSFMNILISYVHPLARGVLGVLDDVLSMFFKVVVFLPMSVVAFISSLCHHAERYQHFHCCGDYCDFF